MKTPGHSNTQPIINRTDVKHESLPGAHTDALYDIINEIAGRYFLLGLIKLPVMCIHWREEGRNRKVR